MLVRASAVVFLGLAALPACARGGHGRAAMASIGPDAGPIGAAPASTSRPAPRSTPRPRPTSLEMPADLPDPFESPPRATDPPPKSKGIQL